MTATADDFIQRRQHVNDGERANYRLFLTELCAPPGLDRPDPTREDTEDNAYVCAVISDRAAVRAEHRYVYAHALCQPQTMTRR